MLRRKARGISEIYTGHKRREGAVKVFRCTPPLRARARARTCVQRTPSDTFIHPTGLRIRVRIPLSSFSTCARGFDGRAATHERRLVRASPPPRRRRRPPPRPPISIRAIGRYHRQNDNGPIKIPNRCYDLSFAVPYMREREREKYPGIKEKERE